MEMFERAAREKFRFPYRGIIGTEDLWDLSVTALDGVFKALNSELNENQGASLLTEKSAKNDILEAKIEIVKHIVKVKLDEADAFKKQAENAEKKQKILAIIKDKQDEDLKGMSIEQLQAMVNNL